MTGPALTALAQERIDRAEVMDKAAELASIMGDIRQLRDQARTMGLYQAYSVIEGYLAKARLKLIFLVYEEEGMNREA